MKRASLNLFWFFLFPASLYFGIYAAFTWPLIAQFNTHFFCGTEDGYQNIWNLWWTNKAAVDLHQLPWFTTWLHHPTGTSLIAHTLAPFNGFMGIALQNLFGLTLAQTYNALVIFSFTMTGITTFWLGWRVSRSYIGALFAGAAFTFCHFHFAHSHNHLQMVSLEWLPLAILAVYELFTRPTILKGVGAAGAVFLVALCDFHLTFYVVMAGTILGMIVFVRYIRASFNGFTRFAMSVGVFLVLTVGTTGLLAWQLLHLNKTDPLQQNHDPKEWSTDLVDPLVPGYEWRYSDMTHAVWRKLVKDEDDKGKEFVYIEHALYVGWAVTALAGYALLRRKRLIEARDFGYWVTLALLFFLFSLGPTVHVAGHWKAIEVHGKAIPLMPYSLLELIFPPLKMGGVPMRLMAMTLLAMATLSSFAVGDLIRSLRFKSIAVLLPLVGLWAFESLPRPQTTTPTGYPEWVLKMRELPPGALIDTTYKNELSTPLYYATGHGHPIGEGYISRYPNSVEKARGVFRQLVDGNGEALKDNLGNLYEFPYKIVYRNDKERLRIYDLTQK